MARDDGMGMFVGKFSKENKTGGYTLQVACREKSESAKTLSIQRGKGFIGGLTEQGIDALREDLLEAKALLAKGPPTMNDISAPLLVRLVREGLDDAAILRRAFPNYAWDETPPSASDLGWKVL